MLGVLGGVIGATRLRVNDVSPQSILLLAWLRLAGQVSTVRGFFSRTVCLVLLSSSLTTNHHYPWVCLIVRRTH